MKITLRKDGLETVGIREIKFEFHHFHVTVGECKVLEGDVTLVYAFEKGQLSAFCITGLKGRYVPKLKTAIYNAAKELAASSEKVKEIDIQK